MTVVLELDNQDLPQFLHTAAQFGSERYGYVVTPNVDHFIRYYDEPRFRKAYADAAFVLLDSRFISYLLRLTRGIRARVCTGSDLSAQLIAKVLRPNDRVVVVGGSAEQVAELARIHSIDNLHHLNPPMGFINDAAAVEQAMAFVEQHSPFRFCLLAVGCPQQEFLAQQIGMRGKARGLALCIGASINFLTGQERRAPAFMQRLGLEWLFRLLQNPRRLAGRYLVRGPRIFGVLRRMELKLRPDGAAHAT
jgi:exopolysaccharide biosynthesis WecB/TagA/CpsF family protein